MSRSPAFQFYPGDWLRNSNLRRCSHAARGAWVDVLCLMHDAEEYGVLRWPLVDISQASGVPVELLKELSSKGVLKGSDDGCEAFIFTPRHAGKDGEPVTLIPETSSACWYSSRFVRDEHVRMNRGKSTQFTPNNQPKAKPISQPKAKPISQPKGGFGERQGDGASTAFAFASALAVSESNNPPNPPDGGNLSAREKPETPKRRPRAKSEKTTLTDWLTALGEEDAIPADDPLLIELDAAGVPDDFVSVAWSVFKRDWANKQAKDWRATFRDAIRRGWIRLWFFDPATGECKLNTTGELARRTLANG